jgi:hypothetical protein
MRDDICDNSVQEGRLWLRYDHFIELTCAVPPIALGLDTKPAKRLPSRDAPEFAPLNGCDADGSLEPTAYRCRLFFVRMSPLGVATYGGPDPSARFSPFRRNRDVRSRSARGLGGSARSRLVAN